MAEVEPAGGGSSEGDLDRVEHEPDVIATAVDPLEHPADDPVGTVVEQRDATGPAR